MAAWEVSMDVDQVTVLGLQGLIPEHSQESGPGGVSDSFREATVTDHALYVQ